MRRGADGVTGAGVSDEADCDEGRPADGRFGLHVCTSSCRVVVIFS